MQSGKAAHPAGVNAKGTSGAPDGRETRRTDGATVVTRRPNAGSPGVGRTPRGGAGARGRARPDLRRGSGGLVRSPIPGSVIVKRFVCILGLIGVLVPAFALAEQKDDPNCKDHPLFTRMPNSWIRACVHKEFDAHAFFAGTGKTTTVEGEYWELTYYPQATATTRPSELQILRNFENAARKLGGTVVAVDKSRESLRLTQNGKEFWIDVWADFTGKYGLKIIAKGEMNQDIVADAAAFSNDLRTSGHVTIEGIYFDTARSELKPESKQAIDEIAKLLKAEPALKLYVVGHTDNVGGLDANQKLSQARAEAVVQALVQTHGIAAARLRGCGDGPTAPVASNDSEEGRAKNRRVELVKQ
jgi:OmpA-OmpF porin, OOP family